MHHTLEQSPCYPIIGKKGDLYYCKVHPEVIAMYLDTIEQQHCKREDPDLHKKEIMRLTSELIIKSAAAAASKNLLYAAFQVLQKQALHNSSNRI